MYFFIILMKWLPMPKADFGAAGCEMQNLQLGSRLARGGGGGEPSWLEWMREMQRHLSRVM